jgi:hypothetical protein
MGVVLKKPLGHSFLDGSGRMDQAEPTGLDQKW